MFALPDDWVWDFWLADDGERYHLFFLHAPKALADPDARHLAAGIGHAVSDDLASWTRLPDPLSHGGPGEFDEVATWTGSVVRGLDGTWFLFYTGVRRVDGRLVQSIGYATSPDSMAWTKHGQVAAADPRWYEQPGDAGWGDESFRDPWVVADPDGEGWHLLVTARGRTGPADDRGVVGHCWSPDLRTWEVRPPLSEVGQGFGQFEVMHTAQVDGREFLVFSCLAKDAALRLREAGTPGGTYAVPAASVLGPYAFDRAQAIAPSGLYVGRLVPVRGTGEWSFLAFVDQDADGAFGGTIIDPLRVALDPSGGLRVG